LDIDRIQKLANPLITFKLLRGNSVRSQAPAWERDHPEWVPKLELGNQRKGRVWPLNIIN